MYKNKSKDKSNNISNNICGRNVKKYRNLLPNHPSQRMFADMLCEAGLDVDKNVIQRIEAGTRFVTDIELKYLAKVLDVTYDDLLKLEDA